MTKIRMWFGCVVSALAVGLVALPVNAESLQACSGGDEICKDVTYVSNGDGTAGIQLGEPITYTVVITVDNTSANNWKGAVVTDTFGSDLDLSDNLGSLPLGVDLYVAVPATGKQKGTRKWKLTWTIGDLDIGDSASVTLTAKTDRNFGGNQEYTACGPHLINGGANLRVRVAGKLQSFNSGALYVEMADPACPIL